MKIAVCVRRQRFFVIENEGHDRCIVYLKTFTVTASVSLKIYPVNAVIVLHWMCYRADVDSYCTVIYLYLGYVFFAACV